MANQMPAPRWRNVAAWSAVAGAFYILIIWVAALLVNGEGLGGIARAMMRSQQAAVMLGLGFGLSIAVVGFTGRKRPLSLRALRNHLLLNGAVFAAFLLVLWGWNTVGGARAASAMGPSEWAAAVTGLSLFVLATLGGFVTASTHTRVNLVDDEAAAEDLRERGRLLLYSFAWMAACGLLLAGLGLAGPGGVLPPASALAGALVLIAALVVLGLAARRLNDELGRTLSLETGYIAFYLMLVFGGGWAMLAHLGFVSGPAPLDWLTLFTMLLFAAAFVAAGRRNLLTR